MAKATPAAPVITNPLVLALLANPKKPTSSFVDRAADVFVDGATKATQIAGQLSEAVDRVNFSDGAKKQKLRAITKRGQLWSDIQKLYNLTDDELQAVIDS